MEFRIFIQFVKPGGKLAGGGGEQAREEQEVSEECGERFTLYQSCWTETIINCVKS